MTHADALRKLAALYAQIPAVPCQGLCTECCGPLGMTEFEYREMKKATPLRMAEAQTTICPLLKRGRCTVYARRPMICRLWGAVENMPCPWGCRPQCMLTIAEGDALMRQAEELSQALFPGMPPRTMHTPAMIERIQEQGATAVAWAVLATAGSL